MSEFDLGKKVFDNVAVAALYDQVRPGYGDDVVDIIVRYAGLLKDCRILEVGCGTGKITMPFAAMGFRVLALEPAPAMAALAAQKCESYSNVEIVPESFEEWKIQRGIFDLLVSAQAFHWIEPLAGCAKAAEALRTGGSLALVWHQDGSKDSLFYKRTQPIYDSYFFGKKKNDPERSHIYKKTLQRMDAFTEIAELLFPWEREYSANEYLQLLQTFSDYLSLSEASRMEFLRAISVVIEETGGRVKRKNQTQVLLARKR
jgi:SAM-dependent methyltransferase